MQTAERIESLFQELGSNLEQKGLGEPFYIEGIPRHPEMYAAHNFHFFLRLETNPCAVIYLKGVPAASNDSELQVYAALIRDTDRFAVASKLDDSWRAHMQIGLSIEEFEQAMLLTNKRTVAHVSTRKVPYSTEALERLIFDNFSQEQIQSAI